MGNRMKVYKVKFSFFAEIEKKKKDLKVVRKR